ncbi:Clavaminate synthase-like protein [Massarina eburnea CBS 473.64]|uniref:Clavaminate synthase-like protein n=1 Tax=Massarina eburnea CBS 473.64 TaxID=1395130 RepID=A0A6A6S577_9PLEO|nr:Clavaminate synthase-like protein [Massarina eburnea CBS 473.64]
MTLILAGAPAREEVIELWFSALESFLETTETREPEPRPAKRRKVDSETLYSSIPSIFPTDLPSPSPKLKHPIPRASNPPGLTTFQTKVSNLETHTPLIIEGAIEHWPALHSRPWNTPQYLLSRTLGGRRLVPVEIGRSYTDDDWGQKILAFGDFLAEYMFREPNTSSAPQQPSPASQTGYLAQHDLFAQIPSLRSDISVPDYCYSTPTPSSPSTTKTKSVPALEDPLLNAWFGPASTISPLHTDPYHNILAQVVGYKYIRLYAPSEGAKLYPRGVEEGGVDMSNTSRVDLDVGMRVWREISCWAENGGGGESEAEGMEYEECFKDFKDAKYVEGVLGPGECLYIPVGWWHYVRSLSPSFSVSFWFN